MEGIKKSVDNCGALISNIVANILGEMGLLPVWMCAEHSGNHSSRGFTYLREVHGQQPGSEATDKFLEAVSKMIEVTTTMACTKRTAKNIICKCFRSQVNSDDLFKDMIFHSHYLYEPHDNGIRVHSQNGNLHLRVSECPILGE